jgi:hypothetical protein
MESKPDSIGKCPRCGANLALVGRVHRCVALGGMKPAPAVPNKPVPNSDPVPNKQVRTNPQVNASAAARVTRWRASIRSVIAFTCASLCAGAERSRRARARLTRARHAFVGRPLCDEPYRKPDANRYRETRENIDPPSLVFAYTEFI